MAGFPLTAWTIAHPWGDDVDAVLDRVRGSTREPSTSTLADGGGRDLLEEITPRCLAACERWGPSRVAIVLGSTPTAIAQERLQPSSALMDRARERTGIAGPAYRVMAPGASGAKALASAERLLRASLVDAVLAGGLDDDMGALVLLESHGEAFVRLVASAEATADIGADGRDEHATERAIERAWDAAGRAPLGYAQLRSMEESGVVGDVLSCSLPPTLHPPGSAAGALEAVLAAASLVRGFVPEPTPRELEHDRVLVHAVGTAGHHVALVLEARP